jgi:hypothetical protein
LANFQRIIELFTQKIVNKLSKIWVWDLGSEIRDPEKTYSGSRIPDPGVKKAPDPGSGSATLFPRAYNPFFWVKILKFFDADPGSGMEKNRTRDPGWKKFRSGINIPDPQHWLPLCCKLFFQCFLTNCKNQSVCLQMEAGVMISQVTS